jgi:hypothetical protein
MVQKINAKTSLSEIMDRKGAREILSKHRVPCLTCPMAQFEMQDLTIGDVCKMYNLDLKALLTDLNNSTK